MSIATAILLGAFLSAGPEAGTAEKPADHATAPVRHVVFFKFKDGTSPEDTAKIETALRALPGQINAIEDFEWGTDISPEKLSQGYHHALFATFADMAGLKAYGPHPAHNAFREVLAPHRDKVLVFDYVPKTVVATPPRDGDSKPVRHVVLFKFKDGATKEQVEAIEEAFEALPSKIDAIKGMEWGTNVSPEDKAEGFTHCFFLTFADEAGRDAYLPHPAHKEFGKLLGPSLDKVCVVDYKAQE